MPLQATSGAASYDAFGGGVPVVPAYIEDVFSTYLYTGNGSTQTITNGIDLSTKGGLVWQKDRSQGIGYHHILQDTARGATNCLFTNLTNAQSQDGAGTGFVFNNNGFTIGTSNVKVNASGDNYASWTFRKQPKFFDVVTYTGNGTAGRSIAHNLGSRPGSIIIKCTSNAADWRVWHRSIYATNTSGSLSLNTTGATTTSDAFFSTSDPTSTVFYVGDSNETNVSARTYVAYLFAHNAGGFGLTGTDNVISCGSYTGNGSAGNAQTLGYEPQWMIVKKSSSSTVGDWFMVDIMRGFSMSNDNPLYANQSAAEDSGAEIDPTATGFQFPTGSNLNASGATYIYIAIRRGPMKVPTSGTSVYTANNSGSGTKFTAGFPPDMVLSSDRTGSSTANGSRLVGPSFYLETNTTASETSRTNAFFWDNPTGSFTNDIQSFSWVFRRAPSFFDVVCYTGTGSNTTVTHNLGVAPEMMIVKNRSIASDWRAYSANLGATQNLKPNTTDAATSSTLIWNDTTPTSSVFSVGTSAGVNGSGNNHVAYLFATCAGVSKVGSYTGTGALQTVNCGFTSGARFVLIKRTDSTGDWWTYDSARGISSGNDPYLFLNSTAAEVTSTNYVDTDSTGFKVTAAAPAGLNASGGTYIFLAIA